jgi:hypothetical protein
MVPHDWIVLEGLTAGQGARKQGDGEKTREGHGIAPDGMAARPDSTSGDGVNAMTGRLSPDELQVLPTPLPREDREPPRKG